MATEKITITLERASAERIRRLVQEGKAASVSGFIQHAVQLQFSDMDGWAKDLDDMLERSGGPLTADEWNAAHDALHPERRARGRRRKAA